MTTLFRFGNRVCVALVCLAMAVVIAGARFNDDRTVEAGQFVLRGEDGKIRGTFEVAKGMSVLTLRDQNGGIRIMHTVQANGAPSINFFDENGKTRAALQLVADGVPNLSLYDRNGAVRTAVIVSPDGRSRISFLSGGGKDRLIIASLEDDTQVISLKGGGGNSDVNIAASNVFSSMSMGNSRKTLTVMNAADGDSRLSIVPTQKPMEPLISIESNSDNKQLLYKKD